jgi:glutaminyl-peptide cyclotransferase
MKSIIFCATAFLIFSSCNNDDQSGSSETTRQLTPVINYKVHKVYEHDTTSYTEGLLVHNGQLYESTGASPGLASTRSLFGVVDLQTGKINKKAELDREKYFGEGIVFLGGKVYQLTYQTKVGFIYDTATFSKIGEFTIPSAEGWGMTTDGRSLIMSDGTSLLSYLDPLTLQVTKTLSVSDNDGLVDKLNELEYINGFIYANVYTTAGIVKIDPATGKVVGQLDLFSLASEAVSLYPGSMEMNGIAYDSTTGRTYITGKMWPKVYEIEFQ